ncbi:MAG: ISNCY family transposase, partial [Planctomycetota bacterium]|nr:ISNCY family transposase [Planctomycetota bacterium]
HLEHNFGHGKKHLSSLLATLNILAFLFHSFLTFCDNAYRLIRTSLPTRKTFFQDIRALMRYHCFASWAAMMDFMMRGLEIGPYETN